jgi:hypothetical protein
MIPTLTGRWHTRFLLFVVIGLPVTLVWSWAVAGFGARLDSVPFLVIVTIFVVGLLLDPIYIQIQLFRWDRDWPFAYQFISMIFEFLIVVLLIRFDVLPYLRASTLATFNDTLNVVIHFTLVFIPSFIALLGFVQIFMVRWRFKGGEFGRL